MPKERSINPAQAQRKADKAKAVKKSKAEVHARRNEKLAQRNPERLQRQIDELRKDEQSAALSPRDKAQLETLEKEVKAIRRAREALGEKAPALGRGPSRDDRSDRRGTESARGRGGGQYLGKRDRREFEQDRGGAESSGTDEDVRRIPMPRDTPPPIPRQRRHEYFADPQVGPDGQRVPHALPSKPVAAAPAQTTYSAAPILRDLKKEAAAFVPAAVAAKLRAKKGEGRLLEPEELDKLEKAGYGEVRKVADEAPKEVELKTMHKETQESSPALAILEEEAKRFESEIRHVRMEEVEDEDF
ncbi:hypothetical protein LTR66_000660 [Elasticomyces elasticus]|nr:hypothetical protein LTR28_012593 [Elasticomyces elasticus]KAK5000505.1 hypothetical protein LTR66_000660 [Elasticomyces elasticus]